MQRSAVYPRVGGGNFGSLAAQVGEGGLSPRGRGKLAWANANRGSEGSIPAWAGETTYRTIRSARLTVYPRVGGGNSMSISECRYEPGLSPRGRGKPPRVCSLCSILRSIPAWAGETETLDYLLYPIRVYPRVGGGNCSPGLCPPAAWGLSPRGRGKPLFVRITGDSAGSIPAWAGETR